jgi:branched-chain amino acid transport system substrate-binding protein
MKPRRKVLCNKPKKPGEEQYEVTGSRGRRHALGTFFAKNGKIRIDGRMVHDMYLFEVKKPEESKGEWDLYKLLATVPGDEAFRPLDKGGCPLLKTH